MTTAVVHYAAAAVTDRGRKRASNEDAFGFSAEHGVYLVCDGMGGAAAGEVASSLAVDEVLHLLTRPGAASQHDPPRLLIDDAESAVAAANTAIFRRSQSSQNLSGMGTTLVALIAADRRAWIINIGDSRGYRLRGGQLRQITLDHSLVEEQVRLGRMDRHEADRSPLRNVITRALGTQSSVTPDVFELESEPGDLYLLCSDGLTRELSDARIEALLRQDLSLHELCALLVQAANDAGGHDNITCLLVRAAA